MAMRLFPLPLAPEKWGAAAASQDPDTLSDTEVWVYCGIAALLVCVAGLMSGLTLGLLSIDKVDLEVCTTAGHTVKERNFCA